jgi:hypothetical protein
MTKEMIEARMTNWCLEVEGSLEVGTWSFEDEVAAIARRAVTLREGWTPIAIGR